MEMIEISNVTFRYKRKHNLLSNFSLNIEEGKIYGLLGKNGAGKSTLLYLMSGLLIPQKGHVSFLGTAVSKREPSVLSEIFIIPEEFDLPPISLTKYVKLNAPFYPNFSQEDIQKYLACFCMTDDVNLGALSMGQKKKVFMSFALATNTKLLIMDEPTNGLDIPSKSQFRKFMALGMTDKKTIIISTHQVQDVDKMLEHIIIIDENKVLLNQSTSTITSKLCFVQAVGKVDVSNVLYALPTIDGNSIVMENVDNKETPLNLELLYNALLNNGEVLGKLLNKQKIAKYEK